MGKQYEKIINNFSGGMTKDLLSSDLSKFSLASHFDTFTFPHKIIPRLKQEDITGGAEKAYERTRFQYGISSGSTYKIFSLGHGVGGSSGKAQVQSIGLLDANWNTGDTDWISAGVYNLGSFLYYTGFLYAWTGGRYLSKIDPASAIVFNDTFGDVTAFTNVAQAVVHPADNVSYHFTDNKVHTLDSAGTFTVAKLTLPSTYKITCACPHNEYLAIGMVSLDGLKSIVFLWDRTSVLTGVTARYDFGEGEIFAIGSLDNNLIGVMSYFLDDSRSLGEPKIIIRQASGSSAVTLNEIIADANATQAQFPRIFTTNDQRIYFPCAIPFNGDDRLGIWSVNGQGKYSLEFIEPLAVSYQGIFKLGNYWFIAFTSETDSGQVSRTLYPADFSSALPSIYETILLESTSYNKQLNSVGVLCEPLESSGSITLKYRLGDSGSWTTIFTVNTAGVTYHEAINIESTGVPLSDFRELQFRVESLNGAVIRGIKYIYEIKEDNLI